MLLPPPVPGPLSFQQLIVDRSGSNAQNLAVAQISRARLRTSIKETRKAKTSAMADWSAASRNSSEYLTHVYAILACIDADILLWKDDPLFTWRFSLSQNLIKSKSRVSLPCLHYEICATLLTYAICLANEAAVLVGTLGSYETSSSVSSAELKTHDETVNQAAEKLCRSSGVLTYLTQTALPRWEGSADPSTIKGRPVELGSEVVTGLSKVILADANLLAIRRLLSRSKSNAHSTIRPGPPLPTNHPSPSLLAKLHVNVFNLYDEARSLCKTASRVGENQGEVDLQLRKYLSQGRQVAESLSYKWLGIDSGENGGRAKAGEALRWLMMAKEGIEVVLGESSGLKAAIKYGSTKWSKESKKIKSDKLQQELDSINAFLSAYKKVNDTIHFQPIPSAASVQPSMPAGRAALNYKAFAEPIPSFRGGAAVSNSAAGGGRGIGLDTGRLELKSATGNRSTHLLLGAHGRPEKGVEVNLDDLSALNLDDSDSSEDEIQETENPATYFGANQYW